MGISYFVPNAGRSTRDIMPSSASPTNLTNDRSVTGSLRAYVRPDRRWSQVAILNVPCQDPDRAAGGRVRPRGQQCEQDLPD